MHVPLLGLGRGNAIAYRLGKTMYHEILARSSAGRSTLAGKTEDTSLFAPSSRSCYCEARTEHRAGPASPAQNMATARLRTVRARENIRIDFWGRQTPLGFCFASGFYCSRLIRRTDQHYVRTCCPFFSPTSTQCSLKKNLN